jgi:hypothetical protein
MKAYSSNMDRTPNILKIGTRWKRVVTLMTQPIYPGKESPVPTE